jgi:mono/diheme cytochrome c family protein
MGHRREIAWLLSCLVTSVVWADIWADSPTDQHTRERAEAFESRVRPVLLQRCQSCHGPEEQSSSFRVDSRDAILKGGELGKAIIPGEPENSPLVHAIRRQGERPMPPEDPLTPDEVDAVVAWIRDGAHWPATTPTTVDRHRSHWAFQPMKWSQPPTNRDPHWPSSPIDSFTLATIESASLMVSPPADRRTLLRRATIDLTGLLPTRGEVGFFESVNRDDAFEREVDRLLASPHFGEASGRRWLDVARYSDTKGYVYGREERNWLHSWSYRDWVVRALNEDLPYDRFLLLQIAGDQVAHEPADGAAMGYLTLGRRFLGVTRDIIDDRIDVVTRGTMGLTVGCARCHDHKYDPISTKDYYSLYGIFDSSGEKLVRLPSPAGVPLDQDFEKELARRQKELADKLAFRRTEAAERVRARIKDYLLAQQHLEKYPVEGFDVVIQASDVVASFARRWRDYLDRAEERQDAIFVAWRKFADLPADRFVERAPAVTEQLRSLSPAHFHPLIAAEFGSSPTSIDEVADRYDRVFKRIDGEWKQFIQTNANATTLPDAAAEQLRQVLYGADAPCEPPDESIVGNEFFFTTDVCVELWKFQGEVDRWVLNAPHEVACSLQLVDRPAAKTPRVFRRGNPLSLGDKVPRRFLAFLSGSESQPFTQGRGRGERLVQTPSDFGLRAETPSHPALLDYLGLALIEQGWSLKSLHREMITSATYRQDSRVLPESPSARAAFEQDPENRLLARSRARRLTFEEWRDAALAVAEDLDLAIAGRPEDLFSSAPTRRRAIYGRVDRQFLPSTLRVFDFANPDLHIPQRGETIVPQQALFFLNDPFVVARARALAAVDLSRQEPADRLEFMFDRLYQRKPTPAERAAGLSFVQTVDALTKDVPPPMHDWSYGVLPFDAETGQAGTFTLLPFFNGKSWQGSPDHPDSIFGWAEITADGGHAGNDHDHATARRWTAPRDMTINLQSQIIHPAKAGDGILVAVLVRGESIAQVRLHDSTTNLGLQPIAVKKGETIDLVVDRREMLNHDEFTWTATLVDTTTKETWSSVKDFAGVRSDGLDRWEQLAQILLTSNEFLFVD